MKVIYPGIATFLVAACSSPNPLQENPVGHASGAGAVRIVEYHEMNGIRFKPVRKLEAASCQRAFRGQAANEVDAREQLRAAAAAAGANGLIGVLCGSRQISPGQECTTSFTCTGHSVQLLP